MRHGTLLHLALGPFNGLLHLLSYTVHKIRHVALPLPIENLYNIPYLFGEGGMNSEGFSLGLKF